MTNCNETRESGILHCEERKENKKEKTERKKRNKKEQKLHNRMNVSIAKTQTHEHPIMCGSFSASPSTDRVFVPDVSCQSKGQ